MDVAVGQTERGMMSPLRILGRVGKGLATYVGLGGVAATTVALEGFDLNEALTQVLEIIRALLALVAALGFGRKTGYAANE